MPVLEIRGLNKTFGSTVLFRDVDAAVHEGDKVALVGRNGTGKTTLMRIIAGSEDYDSGVISMPSRTRMSYLSQTPETRLDKTLFDYAMEAFSDIAEAERELTALLSEMSGMRQGSAELKSAIAGYDRLLSHISANDGYGNSYKARSALFGLGFCEDDLERKLNTLSGGQLMRASLARLLLSEPDMMLLDEPTNHLDLSSIEWLEGFLKSYKGSMVLVSHDRYFLESVADHVWELDELKLTCYEGSYEDYLAQKQFNLEQRQIAYERQQERMEKLAEYIRRYKAGNRTTMAQSREKMLERVKERAVTRHKETAGMSIGFGDVVRTGKYAITAKGLSKAYGPLKLFSGLDVHVERGERLGVVGPNGSGKTTLIRILAGDLSPDEGEVRPGVNMRKAVFYQDIRGLDEDRSVLDHIYMRKPWTQGQARDYLARFLFRGEDVFKRAADLSGGERNRLMLAMMLLDEPNLIILDEPTNHLDIASRHALEEALSDFGGTVVAASHDRYFLDRIATRILLIEDGKARYYDGNYTYYRESRKKEKEEALLRAQVARQARPEEQSVGAKDEAQARNAQRNERRMRERLIAMLAEAEAEVLRLEDELEKAEAALANPDTYKTQEAASYAASRLAELNSKLEAAFERWHELEDKAQDEGGFGFN